MPDGPVIDTNLGPPPVAQANPIAQAGGPIGLMNDLAEIRLRQNQNQLFQQQMLARHKMGEDLTVLAAQGKSPEEQIGYISHQPYAPYVTPEIGNFRASNLAGVQVQKTEMEKQEIAQRMNNAGLGPLAQALVSSGGDPAKAQQNFDAVTAGLSPEQKASQGKAYKALKESVFGNLPKDPDAAHQAVVQNLQRIGGVFGIPLDSLYAATTGGVKPGVQTLTGAAGQQVPAVVSGTSAVPLTGPDGAAISGPSVAAQEQMKIQGAQAAGLPPTPQVIKDAAGAEHNVVTTGGGASPVQTAAVPLPGEQGKSPPVPTAAVGPSLAAQEYLKKSGELGGNIAEEVSQNSLALPVLAKRVGVMADALKEFQAGGGTSSYAALGSFAQALQKAGFPIETSTINSIANKSLPAEQVFESLISRAAVQALKADAEGTGRVMRSEVDRYLDAIGANKDPGAIRTLFNNLRWNMLVGYDQAQKFGEFKKEVRKGSADIADFGPWYAKNFDEGKMEAPKGIDLKEIPKGTFKGEEAPGLPPGAKVLRKNPQTGKWE